MRNVKFERELYIYLTYKSIYSLICPDFCQQYSSCLLVCETWILSWSSTFSSPLVITFQWWRKCWLCWCNYSKSIPYTGMIYSWNLLYFFLLRQSIWLTLPTMYFCLTHYYSGWRRHQLGHTYFAMKEKKKRKQ